MRLRVLLSYWHFKRVDLDALVEECTINGQPPDLWGDSGAFTAMTKGAVITCEEYAAWVHRWTHLLSAYCNLDVIGDPVGTMLNQRALEDLGIAPLPVYHMRANDPDLLVQIADEYPYACLGGMAGTGVPPSAWLRFVVDAMVRVRGSECVWHGLGQTGDPMLGSIPWYSVDSSTWSSARRWGYYALWDPEVGRTVQARMRVPADLGKYGRLFRRLGIDPRSLLEDPPLTIRDALGVATYLDVEQWARARHGPVIRPDQPDAEPGLRVYAAVTSTEQARNMAEGLRAMEALADVG